MRTSFAWLFRLNRFHRVVLIGWMIVWFATDGRGQSGDSVLVKGGRGDKSPVARPVSPQPRPQVGEMQSPKKLSVNTWETEKEFDGSPQRVHRRKRHQVPPVAIEWRLLRRDRFSSIGVEINPFSVLRIGDQIRIGLRSNRSGYWYVIGMSEDQDGNPTGPPRILFPASGVNGGRNFVERDQEVFVPFACSDAASSDDCWMHVMAPAGREVFLAIFSRDVPFGLSNGSVQADGVVPFEVFERIKSNAFVSGREDQGASFATDGKYRLRLVSSSRRPDLAALIVLPTTED